jgi:tripartite-type tricarboxylate transporter receptor subunit TctC
VEELIAYDKANPGKLNYGTSGTGSRVHLGIELFNQMAGTRLTHVPYKGGGPLMNDLLGGQIQLTFSAMIGAVPHIRSNRLRGIAVTTPRRSSVSPDLPTAAETIPGYELMGYFGILGPKGLPKEIIALWNSEINRILKLPDVRERMSSDGAEPVGGSPEQFREMLGLDIAKWQKVVRVANIKPD